MVSVNVQEKFSFGNLIEWRKSCFFKVKTEEIVNSRKSCRWTNSLCFPVILKISFEISETRLVPNTSTSVFYVFFPVHFDMNNKYHNTTDQTFEIVLKWTKDPPFDRRMLIFYLHQALLPSTLAGCFHSNGWFVVFGKG